MSYSPYTSSTPPRPFRIMVGGTLAIFGLFVGMGVASYQFHKALLVENDPVEMTWETLVQEGYGETPYIRLMNIEIIEPEIDEFWNDEMLGAIEEDPEFGRMVMDEILGPAQIIPRGGNENIYDNTVVIPPGADMIEEAARQIEEDGSLNCLVTTYSHQEMILDIVALLTGQEIDPELELEFDDSTYKLIPVDDSFQVQRARDLFLFCGFTLALGLVMCGSGGPGLWTIWFAPVPSLISLVGYPMRYGRGGTTTRIVYGIAGTALMANGYNWMVLQGQFGQGDGNPICHALGFASLFIGLGAVLAIPLQITARALHTSIEPTAKKKEVKMSWAQACSLDPVEREVDYEDDVLAPVSAIPLTAELKEKSSGLEATGFSRAESMQWQREDGLAAATVQVGCESMVVSDLEYHNDSEIIESTLISVLGTGLPIITLSANAATKIQKKTTNCLIQRSQFSDPSEMLAEHLEEVVGEAEKRDTIVVEIGEDELQDVVLLARRARAEVQEPPIGMVYNVGPARYGRFHFPPVPVPERIRPEPAAAERIAMERDEPAAAAAN